MKLDYFYRKTDIIQKNLRQLEVLKQALNLLPPLPHIERNLRRQSVLKSSLFSARIEGNRLNASDISFVNMERKPANLAKLEIFNISRAINFLYSSSGPAILSKEFLLELHKRIMQNISPLAGVFRQEPSAIFNQAGVAIYLSPPPKDIPFLLEEFIKSINSNINPIPVKAAISHFTFEKIHPFLDGNGRVGRLISTYILKNGASDFRGLVSLEEYLDNNRESYYYLLNNQEKDITPFVEFFLEGLMTQAEKTIEEIRNYKEERKVDALLPRRREILEVIQNHQMVSFDFIRRRFMKIPESTLHYDLNKLSKGKFIRKLGNTRGAVYSANREES